MAHSGRRRGVGGLSNGSTAPGKLGQGSVVTKAMPAWPWAPQPQGLHPNQTRTHRVTGVMARHGTALAPALCFSADSMVAGPAGSAWAGGGHRGLSEEGTTAARGPARAGGTRTRLWEGARPRQQLGQQRLPGCQVRGKAKRSTAARLGRGSGGRQERGGAGEGAGPG